MVGLSSIKNWFARLGAGAISGILLLVAALVAMVWANSGWAGSYNALWSTLFTVGIGDAALSKPLILWVNDGLMAIFFLLVGLEIKRELIEGALSTPRRAALPAIAAAGGMAVPALIYVAFNFGGEGLSGWAIPAATDIAFALGILALLGRRVPVELKVFLTAVAVVDDLGAVLVIALFYTGELATGPLLGAAVAMVGLIIANRSRTNSPIPYLILGAALWLFVLKSGVHATVAGVLLALTIPARGMLSGDQFQAHGREIFGFQEREDDDELPPQTRVDEMRDLCNRVEPMLLRWEHALHPWVMFGVMPIFALANAGVVVSGGAEAMAAPVSLGVMLGLLLGKPLGITLFAWVAVALGLSEKPAEFSWKQLHGAGWLAGIGFTMSLFVTSLAFESEVLATQAKIGLMTGSLVAGLIGAAILYRFGRAA